MWAYRRLKESIADQGLLATGSKFLNLLADPLFDIRYGTDTGGWARPEGLTIASPNRDRATTSMPTRVRPLRLLFNTLAPMVQTKGAFVDFGCGKGRALLVAAESGFREVRGVEFAHELCEIAKRNCEIYNRRTGKWTSFQVIESDAVDYAIRDDEDVFFMFNPFDEVVMNEILNNLAASILKQPRKLLIIYNNPRFGELIERHDRFLKTKDLVLSGNRFTLYSNCA